MKILIEILGWAGSISILIAYALLTTRKLNASSKVYQLLNIVGSLLLIVNTLYHGAAPPAALNLAWLGIGIYSIVKSKSFKRESG
jgi:hypothetical protein